MQTPTFDFNPKLTGNHNLRSEMEVVDLETFLRQYQLGQRRTGSHKQFTFLVGKLVYKGPYREEKANKVIQRAEILTRWGVKHLVVPLRKVSDNRGTYFLVFPNVDPEGNQPSEELIEGESFSNYQVRIRPRRNLVKLNDIVDGVSHWTHRYIPDLTFALICLYVLEVGDIGLHNILADRINQKVYIIDYEENLGTTLRTGPNFYFLKIARSKWDLWSHVLEPHLGELRAKLLPLIKEPQYGDRFRQALNELPKLKINPEMVEKTMAGNEGKMAFHGMFGGSVGYSGHELDILKSALQKYIRRKEAMKASMAAIELYRLGIIPGAKAIMTNLGNRLAIIAAEDIGPSNVSLVLEVISGVSERKMENPAWLIGAVFLLANSGKTRLPSHLYFTFGPEGLEKAGSLGYRFQLEAKEVMLGADFWKPQDPEEIRLSLENFATNLEERRFEAFYWLRQYLNIAEGKKVARRQRRESPMILLWIILARYLVAPDLEILQKAFFATTEDRPFLQLAVTMALYRLKGKGEISIRPEAVEKSTILPKLLQGQYTFTLDLYVVDKHTRAGREMGMTREDFVKQGALVIPEDPRFRVEPFSSVYSQ
ncbi:MAG: hypothetical protein ACYCQJ_13260 [Nitrososphaerales archaeon]